MEARNTLKKVVHFANWEYKEKRPLSVKVLRLKSKSTLTMGVLPEFQMRSIGPIIYLVVCDYKDTLMIYFFNKNGDRLGGQNYEITAKFLKKLDKSTIIKYQLPKKERKAEDLTSIIQNNFTKIQQQISNKLGISLHNPFTLLVDKTLPFKLNKLLGCKKVKNEIHIPLVLQEKTYLELLATVEWFSSYIAYTIKIIGENFIKNTVNDFAILLSAVYNPKLLDKIKTINLSLTEITLNNINFNITQGVKSALESLFTIESKKKLFQLLKKYLEILYILKRYKISLSSLEFVQLIIHSYEIFNVNGKEYVFYSEETEDITFYFYFKVFSRIHELAKQLALEPLEYKSYFLSTLFGLNILSPDEITETPYTLTEVIENIGNLTKNPFIYEHIQRIDTFVSHIISDYICRFQICKMQYAIQNELLHIIIEIQNNSNYVLHDFAFKLLWKPKKKIELVEKEDSTHSRDLHEKVKRTYLFTITTKGPIILSCTIVFMNPLFQDKIIKKQIYCQKILLP